MKRSITLFTGQYADLSIEDIASKAAAWGYDGLELACWGEHVDVARVLEDQTYVDGIRKTMDQHELSLPAISTHLVSQAVCDPIDQRHQSLLPPLIWGDGEPEGVRRRAEERVKDTARAAAVLGVPVVVGFTGSSIAHMYNGWPPPLPGMVDAGYADFAERWSRIMDVFEGEGVRFALEAMPGEIGYDIHTVHRAFAALGNRESFGLNFDPSHLYWQMLDEVAFIHEFSERIYHVHVKDARRFLDGRRSILGSHLPGGHAQRAWDFISVGHGDVPIERIMRALDQIRYAGPLSVEWEDSLMDREAGAAEAVALLRGLSHELPTAPWFAAFKTHQ